MQPKDGAVYQGYALLLKERKLFSAARAMFKRGTETAKDHMALWQVCTGLLPLVAMFYIILTFIRDVQAWGLMEAEMGNIAEARKIFQQVKVLTASVARLSAP